MLHLKSELSKRERFLKLLFEQGEPGLPLLTLTGLLTAGGPFPLVLFTVP